VQRLCRAETDRRFWLTKESLSFFGTPGFSLPGDATCQLVRRHVAVFGTVEMCMELIRPTEGRRTLTVRQSETIFLDLYVEALRYSQTHQLPLLKRLEDR
jgi:hypothetical protein